MQTIRIVAVALVLAAVILVASVDPFLASWKSGYFGAWLAMNPVEAFTGPGGQVLELAVLCFLSFGSALLLSATIYGPIDSLVFSVVAIGLRAARSWMLKISPIAHEAVERFEAQHGSHVKDEELKNAMRSDEFQREYKASNSKF